MGVDCKYNLRSFNIYAGFGRLLEPGLIFNIAPVVVVSYAVTNEGFSITLRNIGEN